MSFYIGKMTIHFCLYYVGTEKETLTQVIKVVYFKMRDTYFLANKKTKFSNIRYRQSPWYKISITRVTVNKSNMFTKDVWLFLQHTRLMRGPLQIQQPLFLCFWDTVTTGIIVSHTALMLEYNFANCNALFFIALPNLSIFVECVWLRS